ncbi:DinB family protein [Flavobacterium sp. H122]|uniref:DinB family protein n=1 Tax=Flavobacterium sp. H122 TaxID=2529860 RepID=UPI0010A9DDF0|nr:DinB family protein [Flavobacterium sp. H122]
MQFDLNKSITILSKTPQVLETLLSNIHQDWTHNSEGENTWSVFDVLGHLIHGEKTDWIVRSEIILSSKENKTFEPFDRFAMITDKPNKIAQDLLEEFAKLRAENLEKLKAFKLTESDLSKKGIHPELGIVTLKELLSCWVVHDLNHLSQISRVMAFQYKTEVGPWEKYLSILHKKA